MIKGWWKDLPGVLVNASTVGGIAALSMMAGTQEINRKTLVSTGIAFGLTFLIELRKFLDQSRRKR